MPPPKKKKLVAPTRKPGPARQFLIDNFSVDDHSLVCKSGHVLFLYISAGKSILKTMRDINHRFGFEPKYGQVDSLVRRAHPFMENYSRANNQAAFAALFPDLEKKEAADVSDILSGTIIGRRLCHMWFDEDTNSQKMYYGKVLKTKKKKPDVLVIAYWSPKEEEEDDAVDYDMGKFQLAADVIAGELMLS
ncbi:uncharacterized protein [Littorina saxatilis]|uniref:uncharacterized protein n=1 Tax=Littorina saxatilis TaxID=31220 RepID=UPI0038B4FE1B